MTIRGKDLDLQYMLALVSRPEVRNFVRGKLLSNTPQSIFVLANRDVSNTILFQSISNSSSRKLGGPLRLFHLQVYCC